jgi:hypothetical protein
MPRPAWKNAWAADARCLLGIRIRKPASRGLFCVRPQQVAQTTSSNPKVLNRANYPCHKTDQLIFSESDCFEKNTGAHMKSIIMPARA